MGWTRWPQERVRGRAVAALIATVLTACSPSDEPARPIAWSIAQDADYFARLYHNDRNMLYRISEIEMAADTREYDDFLHQLGMIGPVRDALLYYEVSSSASYYTFAAVVEGAHGCQEVRITDQGASSRACEGIRNFLAPESQDTRRLLDPAVVVLVQWEEMGEEPRREISIMRGPLGYPDGLTVLEKVALNFEQS